MTICTRILSVARIRDPAGGQLGGLGQRSVRGRLQRRRHGGDQRVDTGVNIALGTNPVTSCPSFDINSDGTVAINELIAAVNNALERLPRRGGHRPTATPTTSPTTSVTPGADIGHLRPALDQLRRRCRRRVEQDRDL